MKGLPGDLYRDIRNVLMDCGPFNDQVDLQPIFTHPDLYAWRNSVPGGRTKQALVDALITFLYNKPYDKPNPLGRFLNVLSERVEEGCQKELSRLAGEIAVHLGEIPPPDESQDVDKIDLPIEDISKALLSAYDKKSLERMLMFKMGVSLDRIVGDGNLEDTVFELIKWAMQKDRLKELVLAAHDYNQGNQLLASVAQQIESSN